MRDFRIDKLMHPFLKLLVRVHVIVKPSFLKRHPLLRQSGRRVSQSGCLKLFAQVLLGGGTCRYVVTDVKRFARTTHSGANNFTKD